MTDLDEHGRPEPPPDGDETATLLGFLEYQRATFAWKCAGLDAAGLNATVGASSMTLGGMLKHLAYVEDHWFSRALHGRDRAATVGHRRLGRRPGLGVALRGRRLPRGAAALWQDAVARSRDLVTEALADGGLGPARQTHLAGRPRSEPALDPGAHDRGVRPAQRSRRPHPGIGGRPHRRIAARAFRQNAAP